MLTLSQVLNINPILSLAQQNSPQHPHVNSNIVQIVASNELVLCLTQSGVCLAFEKQHQQEEMQFVCVVNEDSEEVIRDMVINKHNHALIISFVHRKDKLGKLHCRRKCFNDIKRKGTIIFPNECLGWPGFVEFDNVNGKALTCSGAGRYKVWSLLDYTELYSLENPDIEDIHITYGVMLVIFRRDGDILPLQILDIENGQVLKSFRLPLVGSTAAKIAGGGGAADFVSLLGEKLLFREHQQDLHIIDVISGDIIRVPSSDFLVPNAYLYLNKWQLVLTFKDNEMLVWNLQGQCVTRFEDHVLMTHEKHNANNLCVTECQQFIISHCIDGSIKISNILTGKCIGKTAPAAVADHYVSSIFFSEGGHSEQDKALYIGTQDGYLSCWTIHNHQ